MSDYGNPYTKFAFALDGLIRSRVSGHGGEEFARKNIRLIAEALREMHEGKKEAMTGPPAARIARLDAIDRLERDISFLESVIRSDEGYTETVIAQCIDAREDIATVRSELERITALKDEVVELSGKLERGLLNASAVIVRLTEGLREISRHKPDRPASRAVQIARALLAASPSDGGREGWAKRELDRTAAEIQKPTRSMLPDGGGEK